MPYEKRKCFIKNKCISYKHVSTYIFKETLVLLLFNLLLTYSINKELELSSGLPFKCTIFAFGQTHVKDFNDANKFCLTTALNGNTIRAQGVAVVLLDSDFSFRIQFPTSSIMLALRNCISSKFCLAYK